MKFTQLFIATPYIIIGIYIFDNIEISKITKICLILPVDNVLVI